MSVSTVEKDGKIFVVDAEDGLLEVKYGLPANVQFCRTCGNSNQKVLPSIITADDKVGRKNTIYFEDGQCEACRVVARKDDIDWEERERKLIELLDKYRSRNGSWDCMVPGSGGKDSVYQAHILKTKYGMNPLTVTWAPHLYTDVGWRNFQNWLHIGGFDNFLYTPDGQTHRKLTELAYRNLLHPFQPFIFGQRHFPMYMAKKTGVQLIFYGESPAEYGWHVGEDATSLAAAEWYTGDPNSDILISGVPIDELREYGITREKLSPYLPMTKEENNQLGLSVHFLGYFLKWVPQECYYYAVEHTNFEANDERTEGTFSKYNSIDDKLDGFHYWCGHIKFGIGRCTHEACQEIRHGHIDREEGVALIHKYDGEFPRRYFEEILEYMNMKEDEFMDIADRFRSPHLWKKTGNGWILRHQVK